MKKIRILTALQRDHAIETIRALPLDGSWVVNFKEASKRSLEQNSMLWACLNDISRQVDWYGQRLSPENWKDIFSAAIRKAKVVPGIDGNFVILGQHTSTMTKKEFSDLLELIHAFAAEHNVRFSAQQEE